MRAYLLALVSVVFLVCLANSATAQSDGTYYSLDSALAHPDDVSRLLLDSLEVDLDRDLCSLTKLSTLHVNFCRVTGGVHGVFCLPSLQEIRIAGSYRFLNDRFFRELRGLQKLRRLSVNGAGLRYVPDEIGDIQSLVELELNSNNLTSIPSSISNLKALKHLSARHNRIRNVSQVVLELPSLRSLDLAGNGLRRVPFSDLRRSQVTELDVSENPRLNISHLVSSIRSSSIRTLLMLRSGIRSLPSSIGSLDSVQSLNLWGNRLMALPPAIGGMKSLKSLYVGNNKISSLPSRFGELKRLAILSIESNELAVIPQTVLALSSLKVLNVRDNPLRHGEAERARAFMPQTSIQTN